MAHYCKLLCFGRPFSFTFTGRHVNPRKFNHMLTYAVKAIDLTEIHARLFDHRPAIQGHVDYFLKEFEEKRGDREKVRLRSIETAVTDIKDKFLPESKDAMDAFLTNLIAKLKVATEVCKKIEEKENNIEIPYLEDQREQRKKNWEDFMQRQFEHSAEVDQEYDAQVIKLSKEYSDLEDKLISDYKTRP